MADTQATNKVRLFHKSNRTVQMVVRPPTAEKLKARAVPSGGIVGVQQQDAVQRSLSKETKLKSLLTSDSSPSRHKSPVMRLRKSKRTAQSLISSFANSHEGTPRSLLTLDAINLELQLSDTLSQVESLPKSVRPGKRIQAFIGTLEEIARVDTLYGEPLRRITTEISVTLAAAQVSTISELQAKNSALGDMGNSLMEVERREKEAGLPRVRVLENLGRENALLGKKCEELEGMRRRGRRKGGQEGIAAELREMTRKIKELDEEVRAARVREAKLTDLLNWMQADSSRSSAYGTEDDLPLFPTKQSDHPPMRPSLVPPLYLPSADCSPQIDSALNKGFEWSASTGTGALKSAPGSANTGERWESM